jgi:DNA-binding protein HU-beta
VETKEIRLTKFAERTKVKCGTVSPDPHEHWRFTHQPSATGRVVQSGETGDLLTKIRTEEGASHMAKGLTKTALVRQLAEKLELTNKQTGAFLDLLAETAVKETKKNGEFTIPGIGKLVKAERKARLGRNPQTGETIKIKAKTVVKFRVAKVAKDTIAPPKK